MNRKFKFLLKEELWLMHLINAIKWIQNNQLYQKPPLIQSNLLNKTSIDYF